MHKDIADILERLIEVVAVVLAIVWGVLIALTFLNGAPEMGSLLVLITLFGVLVAVLNQTEMVDSFTRNLLG